MQRLNLLLIIFIIIAAGVSGTAIYFYLQYSGLQAELAQLKDEKSKIATELAVLKATDLAQKAELLQLRLTNAEKNLGEARKKTTELETNTSKIKPYVDATSAIDQFFSAPMTAINLANIDTKVSALKDNQVTSQWLKAKAGMKIQENSWSVSELVDILYLINSKIRNLLPQ